MTHKWLRLPKAETKEQWLKDRESFHWEVRRGHAPKDSVFVAYCKNHADAVNKAVLDCKAQDIAKIGFSFCSGMYSSFVKGSWECVMPTLRKYWLRPFSIAGVWINTKR